LPGKKSELCANEAEQKIIRIKIVCRYFNIINGWINNKKDFQITLSVHTNSISINLYKEEHPHYDLIYNENFSNLNLTNIEELILFCEKILKNKVFLWT
jgi:hypothetical protein